MTKNSVNSRFSLPGRATAFANAGAQTLAALGVPLRAIASAAGVSRNTAHKWIRGVTVPERERRPLLEQAFGVPRAAWVTAPDAMAAKPPAAGRAPLEASTAPRGTPRTALDDYRDAGLAYIDAELQAELMLIPAGEEWFLEELRQIEAATRSAAHE